MTKSYKVEYRRSGIKYESKYVASIESAVRTAKAKGFAEDHYQPLDTTPIHSIILERIENDQWETVATVDKNGVHPTKPSERRSYDFAKRQIERYAAKLEQARELEAKLAAMSSKKEKSKA